MYNFTKIAIDIKHNIITIYNKNDFVLLLKNKKSEEIVKLATSNNLKVENLFNKIPNENEVKCIIHNILDSDKHTNIFINNDTIPFFLGATLGAVQIIICKNFNSGICGIVAAPAILGNYFLSDYNVIKAIGSLKLGHTLAEYLFDFGIAGGITINVGIFHSAYVMTSIVSNTIQFDQAISQCLESHDVTSIN